MAILIFIFSVMVIYMFFAIRSIEKGVEDCKEMINNVASDLYDVHNRVVDKEYEGYEDYQ